MGYEIAVIGDRDTVVGFALAGVTRVFIHETKDETLSKLNEFLTDEKIGLLLVTHRIAEELEPEFKRLIGTKRLLPLVLRIPDKTGYVPEIDELREMMKRAIGIEVVLRKETG